MRELREALDSAPDALVTLDTTDVEAMLDTLECLDRVGVRVVRIGDLTARDFGRRARVLGQDVVLEGLRAGAEVWDGGVWLTWTDAVPVRGGAVPPAPHGGSGSAAAAAAANGGAAMSMSDQIVVW